ncbi:MAG: AAA family ATPase [Betaproteobacteria bacterium]|nr:AAA family ATPase [Betaproteobacteria bacterium]
MIKGFAVHNFRSFRDSGRISLDPLTCLVGRNSSGKSSILHALMLLRQSNEYRALGARVPQLNLNGPLIEAGDYKDVISGHNPDLPLGFVFYLSLKPLSRAHYEESQTSLVELDIPRRFERERLMFGLRYRHFYQKHEQPT